MTSKIATKFYKLLSQFCLLVLLCYSQNVYNISFILISSTIPLKSIVFYSPFSDIKYKQTYASKSTNLQQILWIFRGLLTSNQTMLNLNTILTEFVMPQKCNCSLLIFHQLVIVSWLHQFASFHNTFMVCTLVLC